MIMLLGWRSLNSDLCHRSFTAWLSLRQVPVHRARNALVYSATYNPYPTASAFHLFTPHFPRHRPNPTLNPSLA